MDFDYSPKVQELKSRVEAFMADYVYPNEAEIFSQIADGDRWQPPRLMEDLKGKAKAAGLWNLFLPESEYGAGLSNLEYAPLCEVMGRSPFAPEIFNCSAPDTGNMEVLVRYGTRAHKEQWLKPLLNGEIRSAFAMTEPEVASSDATNIQTSIRRDGDSYVINGRKWWTSGALDPRCRILIVMGKSDPGNPNRHLQQSMILVPLPFPGVVVKRVLPVFGYDEAPHVAMRRSISKMCRCPLRTFCSAKVAEFKRDRARTAGPRQDSSLHAAHRACRARLGENVPKGPTARHLRSCGRRPERYPGAHC